MTESTREKYVRNENMIVFKVEWFRDDNSNPFVTSKMTYKLKMRQGNIAKYKCVISNKCGKIVRTFKIITEGL